MPLSRKGERWLPLPLWLAGSASILWTVRNLPPPVGVGMFLLVLITGWALLWRRRNRIPVLNYHAVTADGDWLEALGPGLATHPGHLDAHLADLARKGVDTLFVSEVADTLQKDTRRGKPRAALTFDDGFADAWHTLLPLLRKHRVKATLFVNPAMIEPGDTLRDGKIRGYLNQAELQALHESGLVEIQPHGFTHDRLPWSAEPEPARRDVWAFMRRNPDRPWAWPREAPDAQSPLPEAGPALARPAWKRKEGRLETETEFRARVRNDLVQAREALAELLPDGDPVMCWPENLPPADADALLSQSGYQGAVCNRFPGFNRPGKDPVNRIARIAVPDLPGSPQLSLWIFRMLRQVWEGRLAAGPLLGALLWVARRSSRARAPQTSTSGLPARVSGQPAVGP